MSDFKRSHQKYLRRTREVDGEIYVFEISYRTLQQFGVSNSDWFALVDEYIREQIHGKNRIHDHRLDLKSRLLGSRKFADYLLHHAEYFGCGEFREVIFRGKAIKDYSDTELEAMIAEFE